LNRYYKTTIFTSFLMKLIGKISSLYQLQNTVKGIKDYFNNILGKLNDAKKI